MKKMNCLKGFTLIELLIAVAISGLVAGSIYTVFRSQHDSYVAQEQIVEIQQNIRAAMYMMAREIRMAGYDPDSIANARIISASNNLISFSFVADDDGTDNDNDGSTDEAGELETITYDVYDAYGDGDNDIGRQVGTATKRAIAENIEQLELFYTLSNGTTTLAPTNMSNIRTVQITILARAGKPDRKFTNTSTYTTPGGQTWGPFNDNFRRRFMTTNVKCRNMGL
jgi:type IV pilus assembly protein PilW